MDGIRIRTATADDAATLAEFAERVFDEVFSPGNDEGDMASYLNEAFGTDKQRAEIMAPGSIVLLAEEPGGTLTGYLHILPAPAPPCVSEPSALELKRLYVDPARHSRGIGKALLEDGLSRARATGAKAVWLGVWEGNFRAQAFYTREGFVRVGEHDFHLGSDRQTDWIMERPA